MSSFLGIYIHECTLLTLLKTASNSIKNPLSISYFKAKSAVRHNSLENDTGANGKRLCFGVAEVNDRQVSHIRVIGMIITGGELRPPE